MILPRLKKFVTESIDHGQGPGPNILIDGPEISTVLIGASTAVLMVLGFSIAMGLPSESGGVCAALACAGYAGVVMVRRGRQATAVRVGAPGAEPVERSARPMQITLHTPDTIYALRHIPSWLALACAAGAVNGFAFLSCEEFVSHITGTSTRAGLELRHLGLAAEYTAVLVSFVVGAIASVIWLQARACRGKRPRWATPLRAVALILTCAAIAGHNGYFGSFDGQNSGEPPFVLLSVLAFAMGLQNAAVASTTGLAVRTTHLTGPATDLGIHLGTAYFASGVERRDAFKGAALRFGKIASFVVGAGLSVPLADRFGYLSLLAPALLILFAAVLSFLPEWGPSDFPLRSRLTAGHLPALKPKDAWAAEP